MTTFRHTHHGYTVELTDDRYKLTDRDLVFEGPLPDAGDALTAVPVDTFRVAGTLAILREPRRGRNANLGPDLVLNYAPHCQAVRKAVRARADAEAARRASEARAAAEMADAELAAARHALRIAQARVFEAEAAQAAAERS